MGLLDWLKKKKSRKGKSSKPKASTKKHRKLFGRVHKRVNKQDCAEVYAFGIKIYDSCKIND